MVMHRAILSLILCIGFARAGPVSNKADVVYRLPDTLIPSDYEIKLTPHIWKDDFTFDGQVVIEFSVRDPKVKTDKIVLHAKDLKITEKPVVEQLKTIKEKLDVKTYTINKENDFLTIQLEENLDPAVNKFQVTLKFEGTLSEDSRGFFRTKYTNSNGKDVWLAATHFEPVGARRAFPCFDEPALKATFTISIQHKENYHAVSNMHRIRQELVDTKEKQVLTTFEKTPKMSTYLVAFVVSDFAKLENEDLDFRVWSKKHTIDDGKYALDVGQKALKELEKYTGITLKSIGFQKMDNMAIPNFAVGAMENNGLVLYAENSLLFNENSSSSADKEGVATVVAHEFAHHFFGNLVSPKWWDWVWLNEGFANYFQYAITDKTESTWRQLDLALVKNLQEVAFGIDSSTDAKSMNHAVNTPTEISDKFDSIAYSKAGSVIRMIENILGKDKFQKGLREYLQKMKEGSATSDDLFNYLADQYTVEEDSDFKKDDFKKALVNWADTPGFPVITVTRDYVTNTSTITQERFLFKEDKHNTDKYYVAIDVAQRKEDFQYTKISHWFKPTDEKIVLDGVKNNSWVILNRQQYGYYRVNYDEKNWKLIINTLNKSEDYEQIHIWNRAQLVDDSLNLARISKLDYSIALELVSYLKHEQDYVPWYPASQGLAYLNRMLSNTETYKHFKEYLLDLFGNLEKTLEYSPKENDTYLTKYQRVSVQSWVCKLGSKLCRDNAAEKLNTWLSDPKLRLADHKKVVLCAGLHDADQAKWTEVYTKYLEQNDSDLVTALGCSLNKDILKNYLVQVASDGSKFKDREGVLTAIYKGSKEGVDVALTYLTEEYHQLSKNITQDEKTLKKYFTDIANYLNKQEHLDQLETFAKHVQDNLRDFPTEILNGVHESIAKTKANLNWVKKAERNMKEYFVKDTHEHKETTSGVPYIQTVSTLLLVGSLVVSQIYL